MRNQSRTVPDQLEPIEMASIDQLRALQLERLRATLAHAQRNQEIYRERFDDHGIDADDLTQLDDLAKYPFTKKDDLRGQYPFSMFAVSRDRIARIHASSGTTGKPTVVGYTKSDIDVWAGLVARSIRASGGRAGDMMHVVYGYGLFTGGLGLHYGCEKLGVTVVPMSGGMTPRQVQLIGDFKPELVAITPSYLLAVADEFERQGIDPAQSSLEVAILGAEPWTEAMRRLIEQRFNIDAIDIYGLSEVIGPGVACECIESKDGLHLWEDHFYPEVIDPTTAEILPDGQEGELVLTTLTKEAMPVIRYRTGDLVTLLPGTARTMRRMTKVTGRSDDMLIIRGVNLYPSQIEGLLLEDPAFSAHYQLEVSRDGPLDALKVRVEPAAGVERGQTMARALEAKIKGRIGVTTDVELAARGSIERSFGKAKRVIDQR